MQNSKILFILVSLFCLFSFLLLCKTFFLHTYPDFRIFYDSTKTVLIGGNPYSERAGTATFLYPPFALLLFVPFTLLPVMIAEKLWLVFSLILFYISLKILFTLCKIRFYSFEGLLLLSLVQLSFPVKFSLGMGQVNMVLLFLISLSLVLYSEKNERETGIVLSMMLLTKLFSPVLFIYFLVKERFQVITATTVSLIILSFFTTIVFGFSIHQYFLQNVLPGIIHSVPITYYNQSFPGFMARLFGENIVTDASEIIIILVLLSLSLWSVVKIKPQQNMLAITLFITLSLIISPLAWQHYFVLLIPSYLIIYMYQKQHTSKYGLAVLCISFLLTQSNLKNPSLVPVLATAHVFYGTFLLWGISIQLLMRKK